MSAFISWGRWRPYGEPGGDDNCGRKYPGSSVRTAVVTTEYGSLNMRAQASAGPNPHLIPARARPWSHAGRDDLVRRALQHYQRLLRGLLFDLYRWRGVSPSIPEERDHGCRDHAKRLAQSARANALRQRDSPAHPAVRDHRSTMSAARSGAISPITARPAM